MQRSVYTQNGNKYHLTETEAKILNNAGYDLVATNEVVEVEEETATVVTGGAVEKKSPAENEVIEN